MQIKIKKMRNILFIFLFSFALTACKFSKSVEKDLISGLASTGSDLSCKDVWLSVNDEKTTRNSFIYGETFIIRFNDIQGFTTEDGYVFPGMEIIITDQKGDTMMYADDLYTGYTEGLNFSPLQLSADITIAAPVRSKGEYSLSVNIWDKKGKGTFRSRFDFNVTDNEKITLKPAGVSYDEVYLFSQGKNKVITNNEIEFDDNIFVIVEGLKGFREENGIVFPGLELKAADSRDNTILDYDDLFVDYSEKGIDASEFASRVSAHFKITGTDFNNPLHCVFTVWDKKSNARISAVTDMIVK
jgi:hypothetical protein